jgi:putative spermidine/putrescine transport system ATP-binding protein
MSYLDLSHLEKSFAANRVVKDFSLSIAKGEFVSLLGPSGCGKTTVLRMVAGFERPDAGAIVIDAEDVTRKRATTRNIGMVFQSYALFPNLTVAGNIGFGLKVKGLPRAETTARINELLDLIGLPELANRYPHQLSGGQQQRVALARALAPKPRVLLLDEPLSALDSKIRLSLRTEIREIQRKLGMTTIFVTHDQEEALSISDRIVVMNGGVAEQVASPAEIYGQPASRFVASFVGSLNILEATVTSARGEVSLDGKTFLLPASLSVGQSLQSGQAIHFGLRPETILLERTDNPIADNRIGLKARILDVSFLGSFVRVKADVAGKPVLIDLLSRPGERLPQPGADTFLSFSSEDMIPLR